MTTELNLPNDVIAGILKKAKELSAVDQLAGITRTTSRRNQTVLTLDDTNAAWHNPTSTPKSVTNATVGSFVVPMNTIYKFYDFHDFQAEDAPGLVTNIVEDMPLIIAESFDKSVFGTALVPSSPFAGFTSDAMTVDDTAASWEAVFDAIADNGFDANGVILNTKYRSLVRKALVEGGQVAVATIDGSDGLSLFGVPVKFRKLGSVVGVAGDWTRAVSAQYDGLETDVFNQHSSKEQRAANAISVFVGARKGFAVADQGAFVPLSVTGA